MRLAEAHPLLPPLQALFGAERGRADRLEQDLRSVLQPLIPDLDAVWIEVSEQELDPFAARLDIGILVPSAAATELADAVRAAVAPISRREDVAIEVTSWTRPDLAALTGRRQETMAKAWPLLGTPPEVFLGRRRVAAGRPRRPARAHAEQDRAVRPRMAELASLLRRRPELLRAAQAEVRQRMAGAPAPEARTWREWTDILSTHRPRRLAEWLMSDRADAVRLRQSLPTTFTRALRHASQERSATRQSVEVDVDPTADRRGTPTIPPGVGGGNREGPAAGLRDALSYPFTSTCSS